MFISKSLAISVFFAFSPTLALPFPKDLGSHLGIFVDSMVDQARGTYKSANLLVATGFPSEPTKDLDDFTEWKLTFQNNDYNIQIKVDLKTGKEEWNVHGDGAMTGSGEIHYPFRPRVSLGQAHAKIVKKGHKGMIESLTLQQLVNPAYRHPLYIFRMSNGKEVSVDSYNGKIFVK